MAKNPKLKKLAKLRKLKEIVSQRNALDNEYKILLAQNAVLMRDVRKANEEIELLRQFMPDQIPEDLDEYVRKQTSDDVEEQHNQ